MWDPTHRAGASILVGNRGCIVGFALSPSGRFAATSSSKATLIQNYGSFAQVFGHVKQGLEYSFLLGLAQADQEAGFSGEDVILWDLEKASVKATLTGHKDCGFSPDGCVLVTRSSDAAVEWQNTATLATESAGFEMPGGGALMFSPDGRFLVGAASGGLHINESRGPSRRFAATPGDGGGVSSYRVSADGGYLVAMSGKGFVTVWNIGSGERLTTLRHSAAITSFSLTRDGRTLVAGDANGEVNFFSLFGVRTGPPIATAVVLRHFGRRPFLGFTGGKERGRWDSVATVKCGICGGRFRCARAVLDANAGIPIDARLARCEAPCLNLPAEAWEEQRLLSECPLCHEPLKFNPFVVDHRDRYPSQG